MGYNFLPSELSAAFAIEQIKKLKKNIQIRNKNFDYLRKFFSGKSNFFELPEQYDKVKTPINWLFHWLLKKIRNLIGKICKFSLKKIIFKHGLYLLETF